MLAEAKAILIDYAKFKNDGYLDYMELQSINEYLSQKSAIDKQGLIR